MLGNIGKVVVVAVAVVVLGASGFFASACAVHVYNDHLIIDAARAADQQRLLQAAEMLKQQQQAGQAGQSPQAQPAK